jgi:hypothetical protein
LTKKGQKAARQRKSTTDENKELLTLDSGVLMQKRGMKLITVMMSENQSC